MANESDLIGKLRACLYFRDITMPVVENIIKKHGELKAWYRESRKQVLDTKTGCLIGYNEVNWILTENVLIELSIEPKHIKTSIYSLRTIHTVEIHYNVKQDYIYLQPDAVRLCLPGKEVTLGRPSADTSEFDSYFEDLVNLLI